jgi:DNA invertase Pin-like site-specific DNA recombinase
MKTTKIYYARVSTEDQNLDRQLAEAPADTYKTFTDKLSGKDMNRPELDRMLKIIDEHDEVYCYSLDRMARNLTDLQKIIETITSKGSSIHFIKENLTFSAKSSNPMDLLLLQVMGAFAQFERSLIKERQIQGIAIAKKAGKYKGGKNRLNDEQIAELKKLAGERNSRLSIAALGKKFGLTSRTSVYSYLKD